MKKLVFLALCLGLLSCSGGSSPSFSGVWGGTLATLDNSCPFPLADNLNALFPMVVSEPTGGTFNVVAADGSVARGTQGEGEDISFTAYAPVFGDYGSIAPYTCGSSSRLSFLSLGDDQVDVAVVLSFSNCSRPSEPTRVFNCFATYSGEGDRI